MIVLNKKIKWEQIQILVMMIKMKNNYKCLIEYPNN